MYKHPLRKIINKIGIDIHKYRQEPNRLLWLRELNVNTVVDIGANIGQFVNEIREILPTASIYSFEPLTDCYEQMVRNNKEDKNFKAFNVAFGEINGISTIERSSYSGSSSLRKMSNLHKKYYPHTKDTWEEKISVTRLDDFSLTHPEMNKKEILIKIDVQGYEDAVIRGGHSFINKAKVVLIEASFITLYEKQPLFSDIYKILTDMDFKYQGAIHQKPDPVTGSIRFEDAIFVK